MKEVLIYGCMSYISRLVDSYKEMVSGKEDSKELGNIIRIKVFEKSSDY